MSVAARTVRQPRPTSAEAARGSVDLPGHWRLAIVTSHPIQYHSPWFAKLAQVVHSEVLYCHQQDGAGQAAAGFGEAFDWDIPLLDGYNFRWLRNVAKDPSVDRFDGCDTPEIARVLADGRYDACLVTGWYLKSYVQAIRACRRLALPVLVRGDSQLKTPRSRLKQAAKYWPYRWLLTRVEAHLYVGRANYEYLRHYGVEASRLFFAPHFVDNERFAAAAVAARHSGLAARLRASAGASADDVVFLFVGKLTAKKRPVDFVRAIARLHADDHRVRGVIVGSGPLLATVQAMVAESRAPILFAGFQNQSQLPPWYAASDCLILPSDGRETWGLVVNEAMACGIPAIVSDAAGSADDMVTESATGFTFAHGDVDALAGRMRTMVDCLSRNRNAFSSALAERVQQYSCERAVDGTVSALASVTRFDRRHPQPVVARRTNDGH